MVKSNGKEDNNESLANWKVPLQAIGKCYEGKKWVANGKKQKNDF